MYAQFYILQNIVKEVLGADAKQPHIYESAVKWCKHRFSLFKSDERRKVYVFILLVLFSATLSKLSQCTSLKNSINHLTFRPAAFILIQSESDMHHALCHHSKPL